MDQIAKLEAKIDAVLKRLERHEQEMDRFARNLDGARRKIGMSPILDEQTLHINARVPYGRGNDAA